MSENKNKTKNIKSNKDKRETATTSKPREGWAREFWKMHAKGQDHLLIPDVFVAEKL
ncbi:MAG: hypothetical protein KI791_21940 [Cyclobacteriaceae bacterium]|nr:hypothetical protein [Cyclobacteriaceae bacterium SS2]